jgi:putative intracellular protease/amidase
MASVCVGAAMLAKWGFLDGLPAATNHGAFAWVAQHGPRVLWDDVARWVDAGKYVTSAGVAAGRPGGRRNRGDFSRIRLAPRSLPADRLSAASRRSGLQLTEPPP